MPDMNKFSFSQMTSNSDGKTSGSGTMGVLICTVGSLCFLLGAIDKLFLTGNIEVITQSIIFVGIGATLLGYRKSKDSIVKTDDSSTTDEQLNS
jgi:hypothetical protein